ncbi:MAG: hybrid sensor histidine kinase/response regulator [Myxococcales bacterium]
MVWVRPSQDPSSAGAIPPHVWPEPSSSRAASDVAEQHAKLLIVDDNPIVGERLQEDLAHDYVTVVVHSGLECLAYLKHERVDLVLLDLMMPDMSGFEVLEELALHPSPSFLPVVVLTASGQDYVRALRAGATDYVTKPWKTEELLARIRTCVALRRRELDMAGMVTRLEHEIEERQRAEARLVMNDRMSSLGVVAAGVAHEMNQPLTYLTASLDMLRNSALTAQREGAPLRLDPALKMIDHAVDAADRVRVISHDIKTFSAPDRDVVEPVDLSQVLESVLRLAGHQIKHRARVVWDRQAVPPVAANAARLSQVMLNVVANAAQALENGTAARDTLRVSTRAIEGGRTVEVQIQDSGPGMSEETLAHAFDLFFTTRSEGTGTGLGLYLSRQILEGFGGHIEIESALGQGTKVTICLPRYGRSERCAAPGTSSPSE